MKTVAEHIDTSRAQFSALSTSRMKTVPQSLAVNILSRAGRAFDEVARCLAKGDQLSARNAVEYWQTVVCADDAEEIRGANPPPQQVRFPPSPFLLRSEGNGRQSHLVNQQPNARFL